MTIITIGSLADTIAAKYQSEYPDTIYTLAAGVYKYAILHSAAANKIMLELNDPLDFDIPKDIVNVSKDPVMILANLKIDPERDLACKLATHLQKHDIPFNVIAFLPFDFEGKSRKADAKLALKNISQYARLTVSYDHQILKEKKGSQLIGEALDFMEMSAFCAMHTLSIIQSRENKEKNHNLIRSGYGCANNLDEAIIAALNNPFLELYDDTISIKDLIVHVFTSENIGYADTEIQKHVSTLSSDITILRSLVPSLENKYGVSIMSF